MASSSSSNRPFLLSFTTLLLTYTIILISQSPPSTQAFSISLHSTQRRGIIERRSLLNFKETPKGGNATYECSPSGPCVYCLYSEKNDDKYRCSETGYHIPLKCVATEGGSKVENKKESQKGRSTMEIAPDKTNAMLLEGEVVTTSVGHRRLLKNKSSSSEGRKQAYITYRSCIPAVFEEKLSVLGFEAIMLGLLAASGPVVYFRRKRTIAMSGVAPVRVQTNSRF